MWEILDKHLADRPYVAGDRLTMGDIPLGPQLHRWMMLVEDRPSMPHLEAWYQRLTERPAFKKNVMIPLQ
ncbi:MAG: glutathione S-transferase [Gammaproteobacteria bacterium]